MLLKESEFYVILLSVIHWWLFMNLELSKPTFSSNISECGKNTILRSFTLSTQEEKQTGSDQEGWEEQEIKSAYKILLEKTWREYKITWET